jgi:hypothetical protein
MDIAKLCLVLLGFFYCAANSKSVQQTKIALFNPEYCLVCELGAKVSCTNEPEFYLDTVLGRQFSFNCDVDENGTFFIAFDWHLTFR